MNRDVIANKASLFVDMDGAQVKKVADIFGAARAATVAYKAAAESQKKKRGPDDKTELIALADEFNALVKDTEALGPATSFYSAVRTAQDTSSAIVEGITGALQALNIHTEASWPPQYFPVGDMKVLANTNVCSVLAGVDPQNPSGIAGQDPLTPAAHPLGGLAIGVRCLPAHLRLAVCSLALANYTSDKPWALSMTPVAFVNSDERREWHAAIGPQAKTFCSLDAFLKYGAEAFTKGKQVAMGLLAHWFAQPHDLYIPDIMADQIWERNPALKHYCAVLILRRVRLASGTEKVQAIWYDPWLKDEAIRKEHQSREQQQVFPYREMIVKRLLGWMQERGVEQHSRYYGGYGVSDASNAGDAVLQSLAYLKAFDFWQL